MIYLKFSTTFRDGCQLCSKSVKNYRTYHAIVYYTKKIKKCFERVNSTVGWSDF